jgi:aminoglycoside phosphotransferase (APT) family kinase protein
MTDTQGVSPTPPDMQRSTRDLADIERRLRYWLENLLGEASQPEVAVSSAAGSNGMSSETILLDATWSDGPTRRSEPLVARLAPAESDVPVFASYDLRRQFDALTLVGQLTSVPVPKMWWMESDPAALGSQFFVMSRVEGDVPPDVMPYTFGDNWLFDSPASKLRELQDSSVAVLAELHAIDRPQEVFGFLNYDEPGATALERHVAHTKAWYAYAVADGARSKLVERCFDWLDGHWPTTEGETVLSWGDSRIGNVMYRDFRPVAVLDWEMAGLGPRELDVAWMLFAHRVFEELAGEFGLPGMPDFMRVGDVVGAYERTTGKTLRNLEFYCTYAAIQWGIVFLRTGMRQAHFDGSALPEDHDDLMHHRGSLEKMAEGRYSL